MKWRRNDYLDLLTFGQAPRPMFVELFGPLIGLEDQWRSQGATDDEINLTAFDWDHVPFAPCGGNTGVISHIPTCVLEETDEYILQRDSLGRTTKLCKATATIPLPQDFPVANMDDWLKIRPMLEFQAGRIDPAAIERARAAQASGAVVVAGIPGGFDMARELMGEEVACLAYYEQPELMHDVIDTLRDTALAVLGAISEELTIDLLSVHEDMAGKSGPLIGPKQINEFIAPYYRDVWDVLSSRGTRLFQMDSDGNMNPVIDDFLACGLNVMYPMEPAAGMDIVQVRQKYGQRLALAGGIDKHVLRRTKPEIRAELEYKLQPMMRQGTVFGLDHRIPNGTPLENYRYYVTTGREILGLPPLDPKHRGWARMAT